jgi:hypothetical protein
MAAPLCPLVAGRVPCAGPIISVPHALSRSALTSHAFKGRLRPPMHNAGVGKCGK